MSSYKVCPSCNTKNSLYELRCTFCFRDVSNLGGQDAAEERPEDWVLLDLVDGGVISIRNGDVVGRDGVGKEVLTPFEGVSRMHARFDNKNGQWYVTDLGSRNGTFIDGKRLNANAKEPVMLGQRVGLTNTMVAVLRQEQAGQPAHHDKTIRLSSTEFAKKAPEQGRVNMAILFGDLKGSVDYFQEMGTIVAHNWIQNLFKVLYSIIEQQNGRHLKDIGDALLAVFDRPEDAVMAAVKMQEAIAKHNATAEKSEHYYMRIGINMGSVLFENNDIFGNAVNVAYRVQEITPPGRIFVSQSMKPAAEGKGYAVNHLQDAKLRGVNEQVAVFEVVYNTRRDTRSTKSV